MNLIVTTPTYPSAAIYRLYFFKIFFIILVVNIYIERKSHKSQNITMTYDFVTYRSI